MAVTTTVSIADRFRKKNQHLGKSSTWGTAAGPPEFFVVRRDEEFDRIFHLPWRLLDTSIDLTAEFRRPGGTFSLKPLQSAALHEARLEGGLLAMIKVGGGKTLIGLLAGRALAAQRTVYLTPSQVRKQIERYEYPKFNKHFYLPRLGEELFIVSYEDLSSKKLADILDRIKPTLIVADEVHRLKDKNAARTKRWLRHMRASGADLVAMTGTPMNRSPREFAHIAHYALRRTSPFPNPNKAWKTLVEWSEALGSPKKHEQPRRPGILTEFLTDDEKAQLKGLSVLEGQTIVVQGFHRRLRSTAGVVVGAQSEADMALVVAARRPAIPPHLNAFMANVRKTWVIGDEEIEEAPRMWAIMRQLALGFYYEWDWPGGVKDEEWLAARAAWHKEVRFFLQHSARPGMDSPGLLAMAAESGRWPSQAWPAWKLVKHRKPPPIKTVWLTDYAVRDVAAFLAEDPEAPAIVWYEQKSFGAALEAAAKSGQLPNTVFVPPGDSKVLELNLLDNPPHVVLSIGSFREGKNLPAWCRNYITSPPASGQLMEQIIGRTHREGQKADEVLVEIAAQTADFEGAFQQAVRDTRFQDPDRTSHKLSIATITGFDTDEDG